MIEYTCRERRLLGFSPPGAEGFGRSTDRPGERDHKQELVDQLAKGSVKASDWNEVLRVLKGRSSDTNKVAQARDMILKTARELGIGTLNLPNLDDPEEIRRLISLVWQQRKERERHSRETGAANRRESVVPYWIGERNKEVAKLFQQKSRGSGSNAHIAYEVKYSGDWVEIPPQEWITLRNEYTECWIYDPFNESHVYPIKESHDAFIAKLNATLEKLRS